MRPTALISALTTLVLAACGAEEAQSVPVPPSAASTTAASTAVATDPPTVSTTTTATATGLRCPDLSESSVAEIPAGTAGFETAAEAVADYWERRGGVGNVAGLTLVAAADNGGRQFFYSNSAGDPIFRLLVGEFGNGWLVAGHEQCWPLAEAAEARETPIVSDPPSTIVTSSGLHCAGEWYAGTYTSDDVSVGADSIGIALDEWWAIEGDWLGWDRAALDDRFDADRGEVRYHTATGRPVLLVVVSEMPSGGWAVSSAEGCQEP